MACGENLPGQDLPVALEQLVPADAEKGGVLPGEAEEGVLAQGAGAEREAARSRARLELGGGGGEGVGQVVGDRGPGHHLLDRTAGPLEVLEVPDAQGLDVPGDARLEIVGVHEALVGPGGDREALGHREVELAGELAELGALAAHAVGPGAVEPPEGDRVVVLRDLAAALDGPVDLLLDGRVALAEGRVRLAAQGDHPLDDVVDAGAELVPAGADVVDVEEMLALGLLLHVGDDLEDPLVAVQERGEAAEPLLDRAQLGLALVAPVPDEAPPPAHDRLRGGEALIGRAPHAGGAIPGPLGRGGRPLQREWCPWAICGARPALTPARASGARASDYRTDGQRFARDRASATRARASSPRESTRPPPRSASLRSDGVSRTKRRGPRTRRRFAAAWGHPPPVAPLDIRAQAGDHRPSMPIRSALILTMSAATLAVGAACSSDAPRPATVFATATPGAAPPLSEPAALHAGDPGHPASRGLGTARRGPAPRGSRTRRSRASPASRGSLATSSRRCGWPRTTAPSPTPSTTR